MTVALAGLIAIAIAMGIGRFAFTPILPMMQQDAGLSVAGGGWLASANYFGFLLGAVWAINLRVRHTTLVRWGLVVIGIVTLWMGLEHRFAPWLVLRALAGIANAWVQIFAFAWCMEKLAAVQRPLLNSVVFAGVGTGIAVAGGFCLVLMQANAGSDKAWIALGLLSLIATALIWQTFGADDDAAMEENRQPAAQGRLWNADSLRLVICFGASGYGYIIPATFLPALARGYIDNPAMFGLIWPVFGAAAALSTFASAWLGRTLAPRQLWTRAKWVLAVGVLAPALAINVPTLLISAVCVGGTFMVITMAGIKEALRLGGAPASLAVGVMTAAFGAGQIVGPLTVSLLGRSDHAFAWASLLAASGLVVGNCVLLFFGGRSSGEPNRA
jgi:predicted MFS family arabinose efflux permease